MNLHRILSLCSSLAVLVGCSQSTGGSSRPGSSGGSSSSGVVVTAISPGMTSCALLSNGTVDCWGANTGGNLGNGTKTGPDTCSGYPCSRTPVSVTGLTGVRAISVGSGTTCAVLLNGTVDWWGANDFSTTGPDTCGGPCGTCSDYPCSTTPVEVTGLTGVTAISAGAGSTCALLSNGTVDCWGDNDQGQLGIGTTTGPDTCPGAPCSRTPVAVTGLTGVTAISVGGGVGDGTACALLSNGTVDCWGNNQYGQLGNGTTASSSTPMAVTGLTGVVAISASENFTCALLSNGTVDCWGLGPGTTGPDQCMGCCGGASGGAAVSIPCSMTPVAVSGLTRVTAISAGLGYACALLSGGTVECWGDNAYGELGNGTTTSSSTPLAVTGLAGVTAISVGDDMTCALLSNGTVNCWGLNQFGTTSGPGSCTGPVPCSPMPVAVTGL